MNKFALFLKKVFKKDPEIKVSEKTIIRQQVRRRKYQIDQEQSLVESQKTFRKIEQMPDFQQAKSILIYWSMDDELPTHDFITKWSATKTILLPVIKNDKMYIMPFSSKEKLVVGEHGIWEPNSQIEYINSIDIAIIPGVAFDRDKNRMGRGKGYYDMYLENKHIKKWGVGFDFQYYDKIPIDSYDIKMDKIFTASFTIE